MIVSGSTNHRVSLSAKPRRHCSASISASREATHDIAGQVMKLNSEANMSALKQVWTQIVRFVKTLEGIDDCPGRSAA
jgi:hypothetical protein